MQSQLLGIKKRLSAKRGMKICAQKKLRIINVVTQMEAGGAQGAALRMARELRLRGHHAETWFLYRKRGIFDSEPDVRVLWDGRPTGLWQIVRFFWGVYRALEGCRPDAVITYGHYANVIVQPIAWLLGVRQRVATQGRVEWAQPALARILTALLGSLGCYTRVIAVSETVARTFEHYPKRFRCTLVTVPNGIDGVVASITKEAARRKYGLPLDKPLIMSVGRLAEVKNHAVLVRALRYLEEWHLVIVGAGELESSLKALAQDLNVLGRLIFLGEFKPAEVRELLRAPDVFAFPSRHEAFGFAVLEAAANGLPIVCSDIPAMKEIFGNDTDNPGALLVAADDEKGYANAIRRVAEDKHLREKLAMNARNVARRYTINKMVDGYVAAVGGTDRE